VNNYGSTSILSTFSKMFEIIMYSYYPVSHHLKWEFNPHQHGFIKSTSKYINLAAYLNFFTPLVHSQCHVYATYFDFRNSFDLIPHALLLRQLDDFGLVPSCHLVPQLADQQVIPCSSPWRTFDAVWGVIRFATRTISFNNFHKRLAECG